MIIILAVAGSAVSRLLSRQEILRRNFRNLVFYAIGAQGISFLGFLVVAIALTMLGSPIIFLARAMRYIGFSMTLLSYVLGAIFLGAIIYFMLVASTIVVWSGIRALEEEGLPRISWLRKGIVLGLISLIFGPAYLTVGLVPAQLELKNPRTHKTAVAKVYVQSDLDTTTMVFDIIVKNPTKETLIFTEGDLAVRTNSKRELTGSVVTSLEIIDSSDGKAKSFAIDPGKAKLARGQITFDNNELRSYALQLGKSQDVYLITFYFVVVLQPFGKGLVSVDKTSWCVTYWDQKLPETSSIPLAQDVPVVCGQ